MIQSTANFFTRIMQRWLPDAFIFAAIITFIVFVAGMLGQGQSPVAMADHWGKGVWKLLSFSMQVTITLVAGHILAQTPLVKAVLRAVASLAKTPPQAIMLMTFVSMICCWLSWGFGLIASALLAKEIAARIRGVHYALLVAAAYSGFLIWHAGLSGSIPLKIAAPDGGAISQLMNGQAVPVSDTIFSMPILTISIILLITLPILNRFMLPAVDETKEIDPSLLDSVELEPIDRSTLTPAEKLEHSFFVSGFLGFLGATYIVNYFLEGGKLSLNTINLIFVVLGILLHKTPHNYLKALQDAIGGAASIVLQFPLYAGIMGMMVHSGLAQSVSEWFVSISNIYTFPLFTFLSAGIVNFFVPSGGGQWAVQAPIVLPAAESLGIPVHQAAMSVALGDAWTNMVQPFWALPLLGIAGLSIKDIMGYCTVCLLWSGLVMGLGLMFLY
ncbi:MAG: TIGR00366 family protein [Agarilytica sp.]